MSGVQSVSTISASPPTERKGAHESADFASLFAQLAHRASFDAAAVGRLTLTIGRHGAPPAAQRGTQGSRGAMDTTAREAPSLRGAADDAEAGQGPRAGADRRAVGHSRPFSSAGAGQGGQAQLPPAGAPSAAIGAGGPAARGAGQEGPRPADRTGPGANATIAPAIPAHSPEAGGSREAGARAALAIAGRSAAGATPGAPHTLQVGTGSHDAGSRAAAHAPAGRPVPAPAPTRDPSAFRAQLAQGLGAALRRGTGEVTLRLRPDSLGELHIHLTVTRSTVDARIRATTTEAHRLLEQSVDTLRAALEARGLHVGRIDVEPVEQAREGPPPESGGQPPGFHAGPGQEREGGAPKEPARESEPRGGAAGVRADPQDDGSAEAMAHGVMEHPGVVYGVADGAARIVMVDALA